MNKGKNFLERLSMKNTKLLLLSMCVGTLTYSSWAQASTTVQIGSTSNNAIDSSTAKTAGGETIAIGGGADAQTGGSIAIGSKTVSGLKDIGDVYAQYKDPSTGKPFTNPQDFINWYGKQNDDNVIKRTYQGHMNNIAIGAGAEAAGGRVISIGEFAGKGVKDNWNIYNVNIGASASLNSKKDYSVAVGYFAGALDDSKLVEAQAKVADSNRMPSVYVGMNAGHNTVSYGNIGIGKEAGQNVTDTNASANIFIGTQAGINTKSTGRNATFPGNGTGQNILIGNVTGRNFVGDGTTIIGMKAGTEAYGNNNVFLGPMVAQNTYSDRSIIIGSQAGMKSDNDRNIAIGNFAQSATEGKHIMNAIAMGSAANSLGNQSIAMGYNAKTSSNYGISLGNWALSDGSAAIGIGHYSKGLADNTVAIGHNSLVKGVDSVGIGKWNDFDSARTMVLGNSVTKTIDDSVFFG